MPRPKRPPFGIADVLALVATAALAIGWFRPGLGVSSLFLVTSDARREQAARLTSFEEMVAWEESVPEYGLGRGTPSKAPPARVDFALQDLLIVPLPSGDYSSSYEFSCRFGGRIVVVHGEQLPVGPIAQEFIIPAVASVVYTPRGVLLVADFLVISVPLVSLLLARRVAAHRKQE